MLIKIAGLIAECEQLYGIRIVHGDTVNMKHVKRLRKKLYALKQTEDSFGELKQDMQFRRYLSRGTPNVLVESVLLAMARNVNKLHNKIQKGRTGKYLFPIKSA